MLWRMKMAEARAAIGDAVSAAITASFRRDLQESLDVGHAPGRPSVMCGDYAPGHDASRVPPVPRAMLRIDHGATRPDVTFTWKTESGDPPWLLIDVPPRWLRDVVWPGYAVLDGHPVLAILGRDADGRPSQVAAVFVTGHFDASMHGWRAFGHAGLCTVAWSSDGAPALSAGSGDPAAGD